jgi:LmbE family N-acetylglucosaminyl deacetylase
MKIAVFAPHPDDETLACGGTIALNIKQGNEVFIVYLTDGRYSHDHTLGISSNPTPEELKVIRSNEAKKAAATMGVVEENLLFLEYQDGTLENNVEEAAGRVSAFLQRINPDSVYFPGEKDRHRDHKATYAILQKALGLMDSAPASRMYVIWRGKSASVPGQHLLTMDISEMLTTKKLAIAEYKSQVTKFAPVQKRPILITSFLNRFKQPYEVFIQS